MRTSDSRRFIKPTLGVLALAIMASAGSADDWPQYLGPTRNSISSQKHILRNWSTNGPEVLWTAPVGRGFGGPVVKDRTSGKSGTTAWISGISFNSIAAATRDF